jgi:phosphomevalonate kinase
MDLDETYRAPGKLILAGEYAVLEGHTAVVAAIDRFVRVKRLADRSPAEAAFVCVPAQGLGTAGDRDEDVYPLDATQARPSGRELPALLRACLAAVGNSGAAAGGLLIDSRDLYDPPPAPGAPALKLGLGSSASTAVAVVGALLGGAAPPQQLLRVADQAHRQAQHGVGSGVDIAAAVYGGLLRFRREPARHASVGIQDRKGQGFPANGASDVSGREHGFACERNAPRERISNQRKAPESPPEVVAFAEAERTGCVGVVCHTRQAASTTALVERVHVWKAAAPRRYERCMERLADAAHILAMAFTKRDASSLLAAVEAGFEAMAGLHEQSGVPLVLDPHHRLRWLAVRYGGAAKPTGAGGGDLGLAVLPAAADLQAFRAACEAEGLRPVSLGLSRHGFGVQPPEEPGIADRILEL